MLNSITQLCYQSALDIDNYLKPSVTLLPQLFLLTPQILFQFVNLFQAPVSILLDSSVMILMVLATDSVVQAL